MPARPRGLLEPCAATSGTHGSEEGGAGKRRPLSDQLDPGSAWVAITRDHARPQVITAADLGTLRSKLSRTPAGTTESAALQAAEPGESAP